jgi:hypothetical protein
MTAKLEESRTLATRIAGNETVVILAKPRVDGASSEDEFMDCVGNKLATSAGIAVAPNNEFVDRLFPWFEPSTAPQRAEGVRRLLARPMIAERIAETGVRYLVWLDGNTRKIDSGGSMSCAVGPGVAGCLGFGWWEKESAYEATIWDAGRTGTSAVHRAGAGDGLRSHGVAARGFPARHRAGRGVAEPRALIGRDRASGPHSV